MHEMESDLAHAHGTRPRFLLPSSCSGVVEKRSILEEREIGSLHLQLIDRWIDQRLDNYRETFATSFSLLRRRGERGREGMAAREGWASAYFPNANGRNNPYFTSRWHRVDGGWDFSPSSSRPFLLVHASREEGSLFAKFSREFSVCRGKRRDSVDLIGPSAFTESLIWDISFHGRSKSMPPCENSDWTAIMEIGQTLFNRYLLNKL